MTDPERIAADASRLVRDHPGRRTPALARDLGVDESAIEWALHRMGRSLGLGQDFTGAWWHHADNPEMLERYSETGGQPSLQPRTAEPDWSAL
jgi:hypothetical protein